MRHDVHLYKWDLETATQTNRCGITGGLRSVHVCQKLMAAAWINGFVNGQEATGKLESLSIYNRSDVLKNKLSRRAEPNKIRQLQLISKECKVVTVNASNNLFLRLLYKLVISIHLNINWIKI